MEAPDEVELSVVSLDNLIFRTTRPDSSGAKSIFAVHTEDLALSVDVDCATSPRAVAAAVDLLVVAGRARHGDLAVLQSLSRRERDDARALRVL